MRQKFLSHLAFIAAVFATTTFSAPAAACSDTANQWDCIHDGSGTYPTSITGVEYRGSGTLSHWYTGTLWCNGLRASLDLAISNGTLSVDVTDFDASASTSSAKCPHITFSNFNWSGSDAGSGSPTSSTDTTPVKISVGTVVVSYQGTVVCSDSSVDETIQNDGAGGSLFDFDTFTSGWGGDCSIDGTLTNSTISVH